jgi:hypothetical protein
VVLSRRDKVDEQVDPSVGIMVAAVVDDAVRADDGLRVRTGRGGLADAIRS